MEKNFTPLDVASLEMKITDKKKSRESFDINTVMLFLIVITLIILSTLLFFLIQKKIQELGLSGFFA